MLGRPLLERLLRPKEATTDLTISMFLGRQLLADLRDQFHLRSNLRHYRRIYINDPVDCRDGDDERVADGPVVSLVRRIFLPPSANRIDPDSRSLCQVGCVLSPVVGWIRGPLSAPGNRPVGHKLARDAATAGFFEFIGIHADADPNTRLENVDGVMFSVVATTAGVAVSYCLYETTGMRRSSWLTVSPGSRYARCPQSHPPQPTFHPSITP